MQRVGFVLLFSITIGLSSCAAISNSSSFLPLNQQQAVNSIKVKADALVANFTKRGWAVKTDPAIQANRLASILIGGWAKTDKKPRIDPVDAYLQSLQTGDQAIDLRQAMLAEINLAANEINSLTNNVELSVSSISSDQVLRSEMLSLEQAVIISRKANKLFSTAARKTGFNSQEIDDVLLLLTANIAVLTSQADAMHNARQVTVSG